VYMANEIVKMGALNFYFSYLLLLLLLLIFFGEKFPLVN